MANKTQEQVVEERLRERGYVDNFWAIETKTSLRLGAIVFNLRRAGWELEGRFGKVMGFERKYWKNFYYFVTKGPADYHGPLSYPSSSSKKLYYVRLKDGKLVCSCPSFNFTPVGEERTCKHVRAYTAGSTV